MLHNSLVPRTSRRTRKDPLDGPLIIIQDRRYAPRNLDCPDEVTNCTNFLAEWPAEQGAFGEYIRYDFPDAVKELPCNEAVGAPDQGGSNCHGAIIRHYTMDKDSVKRAAAEALSHLLNNALHADMVRKKKDLVMVLLER